MIIADHGWWHTSGESILWTAAIITSFGVILRTKSAKWLYRQLVGDPMTEWGTRVVGGVVDAKILNEDDGSSFRGQINDIMSKNESNEVLLQGSLHNQDDLKAALGNIHSCLDRRFAETHERMGELAEYSKEVLAEAIRAKERIRHLYKHLESPLFEADPRGCFTYINPAYSVLTGLSVDEVMGEGWTQVIHPEDRPRVSSSWTQAVEAAADHVILYRIRHAFTGHIVEVRSSSFPLFDAHRNVVGWVGTMDVIPESSILGKPEPHPVVEES